MVAELRSFQKDWQRWTPAEKLAAVLVVLAVVAVAFGKFVNIVLG